MIKKSRNLFIDVMKGLLIILVVIGHLPFFEYDSRTLTLIYSFHMPAFLIMGGILSHIDEKTKFSDILYKRFKGILVPYFIFYLISFIIIPISSYDAKTKALIYMFNGIGNPDYAINLPLWFLTFYFCAITMFAIIECFFYKLKILFFGKMTTRKNKKLAFVEILTFVTISAIMYFAFVYARVWKADRLIFNFEIAMFCLGFVFFGKLCSILVPNAISYIKRDTVFTIVMTICVMAFVIAFFFIWYYFSMKNGRIDLNARDYKNSFLLYFNAIIGFTILSFFAFVISYIPFINRLLQYLGKNSLYILAYHVPSCIVTYNVIIPAFPVYIGAMLSVNSVFSIAFLTACGIIISLLISFVHKVCHIPA